MLESRLICIHCKTPFHPGSGSSLGYVDMPIQREKHTGYPKFEASGLKGCLREKFAKKENPNPNPKGRPMTKLIFGPENDGSEHAGMVSFTDAKILLFPVKSLKGVFSYITCYDVLSRFFIELSDVGIGHEFDNPDDYSSSSALISNNSKLLCTGNKVVLEEYTFNAQKNDKIDKLADYLAKISSISADNLKGRLAIIPDNEFKYFVEMSTEVTTRIKIDQKTGTVNDTGLFTEEFLPTESVLYSIIMASGILLSKEERKDLDIETKIGNRTEGKFLLDTLTDGLLNDDGTCIVQMGGDATIGKGLVKLTIGGAGNE